MRVIEVEIEMKYRRMRNENERMKFSHWLISTKLMRILRRRSFEFSLLNFSIKTFSLSLSLSSGGWMDFFVLFLFQFRCCCYFSFVASSLILLIVDKQQQRFRFTLLLSFVRFFDLSLVKRTIYSEFYFYFIAPRPTPNYLNMTSRVFSSSSSSSYLHRRRYIFIGIVEIYF